CLPTISGRVTVASNTARLTIAGDKLAPSYREIVVTNRTRQSQGISGSEQRFPRPLPQFVVETSGQGSHSFNVTAAGASGTVDVERFTVTELSSSRVRVIVNPDRIPISIDKLIVHNKTLNTDTTLPVPIESLELQVMGGAQDSYDVLAVDAADNNH